MVVRALNLAGLYLGEEADLYTERTSDNPEGYWEHVAFVALNDEIDPRKVLVIVSSKSGSTLETIAKRLGVEKTLLGVDAVYRGKLVARDAEVAVHSMKDLPALDIVADDFTHRGRKLGRVELLAGPMLVVAIVGLLVNLVVNAFDLLLAQNRDVRSNGLACAHGDDSSMADELEKGDLSVYVCRRGRAN